MTHTLQQLLRDGLRDEVIEFDPRDPRQDARVCELADQLLKPGTDFAQLQQLEQQIAEAGSDQWLLASRLAVKLAKSKAALCADDSPLHVSIVFAMYKEHTRILPADQHPHGEDFVARKIAQLQWLFDGLDCASWSMWIVDDGCPEHSGRLAQQVLSERFPDAPVQVLFLEDAIRQGLDVAAPLASTADSQKGGSVVYGMWTAAQKQHDGHVIAFTDADLSTHLGQAGLLVHELRDGNRLAAIGSRREPTSVVIKQGQRNTRGKLFIYLWKSLITPLNYITDTQCGFKAFTAETVRDIASGLIEKRFAFDIELLLKTELRRHDSIAKVPISWIDSEAASTTTGLQPYLSMLKSVVAMYRKYLPPSPDAEPFAELIESMTETQWQHLAGHVPTAIAEADPASFHDFRPVTAGQLTAMIEDGR